MELGISVYPDYFKEDEIKTYIQEAKKLGYKRLFTSMQLSELNFKGSLKNPLPVFQKMFTFAHNQDMKITVDVNAETLKKLKVTSTDLSAIHKLKITTLRIDGGVSTKDITTMTTNKFGIKIEINSSMEIDLNFLLENISKYGNLKNVTACHNWFPREETGMTLTFLKNKQKILNKYNIASGVFIPSQDSPNYLNVEGHGLPTIERHRNMSSWQALQELKYTIPFDYVLFGDAMASQKELTNCAKVVEANIIEIPIELNEFGKRFSDIILNKQFLSRADQPEKIIRITNTRGISVPPENITERDFLTVTMDNINSGRYMGELQIVIKSLPANKICSTIGYISYENKEIIKHITAGKHKFIFIYAKTFQDELV